MMRYQRPTGDCLPLNNGRKSNLRRSAFKEDGCSSAADNGRIIPSYATSSSSSFEERGFTRFRSSDDDDIRATTTPQFDRNGGDVVLQWGQKKRARVSRTEISSSSVQGRKPIKAHHGHGRGAHLGDKISIPTIPLHRPPPPPPPPPPSQPFSSSSSSRKGGRGFNGNYGNGLLSSKETSALLPNRNLEDLSGAANGSSSRNGGGSSRIVSRSSAGKRSPSCAERFDRKMPPSGSLKKDENPKASLVQQERQSGDEKVKVQVFEWPRIYIALSKKEKEDDFLAMKGTKLPQRPKKRAKNIDKSLQYCFPGMWLSDLTRSRYEVREKKCVKKQKGRGLKGMESIESDSH